MTALYIRNESTSLTVEEAVSEDGLISRQCSHALKGCLYTVIVSENKGCKLGIHQSS